MLSKQDDRGIFVHSQLCINHCMLLHTLGCVGVVQSQNVQFIAENPGGATMTCGDFPSETYNNLQVCSSTNVSFTNIRFENCGPLSPNIFVNYSSGIVFDGCIFT